jgi:hypothetical protein
MKKLFLILASGLIGLTACEKEDEFNAPAIQLGADKLVLCPGEQVNIEISSTDTSLDMSLLNLQLSAAIGELHQRTYVAPAQVSENQYVRVQAYYDGLLLNDTELRLEVDGSTQDTFVRTYQLYKPMTMHNMDLLSLPDGQLLAASGERRSDRLFRLVKFDTDGSQTWTRSFGNGSCEEVKLLDNRILAGGITYEGLQTKGVIYEIDLQGNLLNTLELGEMYTFSALEVAADGDILVAFTEGESMQGQSRLMRRDRQGNLLWNKALGQVSVRDLLLTDAGQIAISYVEGNSAYLSLLSEAGEEIWNKEVGAEQSYLPLTLADDGNIVVAAHAISNNHRSFGLQAFNLAGQQIFEYDYFPSETGREDLIFDLMKVSDGFIISGMSILDGTDKQYLLKVDASGIAVWEWSYGNEQTQGFAHALAALADHIYVWGAIEDRSGEGPTAYNSLIKLDTDGSLRPCQQEGY